MLVNLNDSLSHFPIRLPSSNIENRCDEGHSNREIGTNKDVKERGDKRMLKKERVHFFCVDNTSFDCVFVVIILSLNYK